MTESEAWDSLAAHLQEKNHTGVLVLADWFQENGKEEVAVYLRWAKAKGMLPEWEAIRKEWRMVCVENCVNYWAYPKSLAIGIVNEAESLRLQREFYSD